MALSHPKDYHMSTVHQIEPIYSDHRDMVEFIVFPEDHHTTQYMLRLHRPQYNSQGEEVEHYLGMYLTPQEIRRLANTMLASIS